MPNPVSPLLITLEGIDGSGKSTQAALLVERMRSEGLDPLSVREPGGTSLSERVRGILLDPDEQISPRAELLLFAAARAQLTDEAIRPALAAGRPVVCDRFFDSTTAYQGGGRQLEEIEWLNQFHRFTTNGLIPDRTYIIDVSPEVAAGRRTDALDRMEASGIEFFERVRDAYHRLARLEHGRVQILDGTDARQDIHEAIWQDVVRLMRGTGDETPR